MRAKQSCVRAPVLPPLIFCLAVAASAQDPNPLASPRDSRQAADQKASVYVYRTRQMHGAGERSLIFVNDYLAGELHLANYVKVEVPPGPVIITATTPSPIGSIIPPSPTAFWSSLDGCRSVAMVDWRRWSSLSQKDIARCRTNLTQLYQECAPNTTVLYYARGIRFIIKHFPACAPKLNGSGDAPLLLDIAGQLSRALSGHPEDTSSLSLRKRFPAHTLSPNSPLFQAQLRFQAEAGGDYYTKYSFKASFSAQTKLELVDAASATKAVRKLHQARE